MRTEVIEKDDTFWKNEMEPKLKMFYCDCILPELIDPRHTRKMTIRDPDYILEEMEKKAKKRTGDSVDEKPDIKKRKENNEKEVGIGNQNQGITNVRRTEADTEKKDSKTIGDLKEIHLISISDFPKVNIQNFGELSDDEEDYLAGRQLNFNEF